MAYPYFTEPTHDQGSTSSAVRTTTVSSAEGRLVVDAVDKIMLLEPNQHPLVTLLTNVGKTYDGKSWQGIGIMKAPAYNTTFDCFEDYYGGRYAKVSSTYSTGAVTITVTGAGSSSAYIFTVGDIIKNFRTGECMLVATIASSTTITVASTGRAWGTTSAAAGADGDGLYIIGNVNEENSTSRNVNVTRSTKASNYTQIFKTTIAVSDTEKNVKLYGGPDLPYLRAKMGTQHAMDIERAFWFGEKKDGTGSNSLAQRSTGGVLEFINTGGSYVQDQGGVLTAPDFNTFLREAFTYGSSTKTLFCGGIVLQAINEFARGQLQIQPLAKTYGVEISKYVTAFGTINLVHNPIFVEDWAGYGFLLDMDCFRYRYLNNRDTKLRTNVQSPGVDGEIDEYLTEAGLERNLAAKCALLKGVQA